MHNLPNLAGSVVNVLKTPELFSKRHQLNIVHWSGFQSSCKQNIFINYCGYGELHAGKKSDYNQVRNFPVGVSAQHWDLNVLCYVSVVLWFMASYI